MSKLDLRDCLSTAVQKALSLKNTNERIYLLSFPKEEGITLTDFIGNIHNQGRPDESFEVHAEGTVMVGTKDTLAFNGAVTFRTAKKHSFSIDYNSCKDTYGLPSIAVSKFSMERVELNPSKNVGPTKVEESVQTIDVASVSKELKPTKKK